MTTVDTNLIVGRCPFRPMPATVEDLALLRTAAGLTRAVATGMDSILFYDPMEGLASDIAAHDSLKEWLSLYAVINPEFPQLERQVADAAQSPQVAGLRLFPTLHRYDLDSKRTLQTAELAAHHGLTLTVTARLFDGRVAPRFVRQETIASAQLTTFLKKIPENLPVILSMFFFNELQTLDVDWSTLPNVYVDLGCCKPNATSLDSMTSWISAERIVFGTGAPFYYWKGARLALSGARLPEREKEAILGLNAMRILRWT